MRRGAARARRGADGGGHGAGATRRAGSGQRGPGDPVPDRDPRRRRPSPPVTPTTIQRRPQRRRARRQRRRADRRRDHPVERGQPHRRGGSGHPDPGQGYEEVRVRRRAARAVPATGGRSIGSGYATWYDSHAGPGACAHLRLPFGTIVKLVAVERPHRAVPGRRPWSPGLDREHHRPQPRRVPAAGTARDRPDLRQHVLVG